MAYAAVITVRSIGRGSYELQIDETDAGAADEAEIDFADVDLPSQGMIYLQEASLISGTGTTISPQLARVTGAVDSVDIVCSNLTPDPQISNLSFQPIPYSRKESSWFHTAKVDAAADNVIRTIYRLQRGWLGRGE